MEDVKNITKVVFFIIFNTSINCLGTDLLTGSVDVGIAPGSEAGFELSYPELPPDVISKISTIEVKSYDWNW